jgi:hypothetical protein
MPGVKDTVVYTGPEGVVTRQEGLAFTQYHAVRQTTRGPKGRYYNSQRAAINWLRKNHRTNEERKALMVNAMRKFGHKVEG